jgi:hypothetical protein
MRLGVIEGGADQFGTKPVTLVRGWDFGMREDAAAGLLAIGGDREPMRRVELVAARSLVMADAQDFSTSQNIG